MMSKPVPQIFVLFILSICLRGSLGSNSGVVEPKIRCKKEERQALLKIKQDFVVQSSSNFVDNNVLLSSWGDEEEKKECCEWIGIRCSNISDHVITLDLSPSTFDTDEYFLAGNFSSVADLKFLSHLDLSLVKFGEYSSIPNYILSLTELRYLNLSLTGLGGETPPQLGNLSSLQFLDLSFNGYLTMKNLNWLSRLSSIRVVDLSQINMSLSNNWVHVLNNPPPFLTKLLLRECELRLSPTSRSLVNSSHVLKVLDLSLNPLPKSILPWLFHHNYSLVYLALSDCGLGGLFPNDINNIGALNFLDLGQNNFEGIIPESFGNLISLTYINLDTNQLDGFHPKSFRNMTALTHLDLSYNQFRGVIPESFGNMVALTYLDLSYNQLSVIPESFGNMVSLTHLSLFKNQLNSLNPKSFLNMTAMQYLSLESNTLHGSIPEDFGNMTSLRELDVSDNMLEGEIPKSIWKICTLKKFNAYSNTLSGELHFSQPNSSMSCASFSLEYLDLGLNKIMGPLPDFTLYTSLIELHLSVNQFGGMSRSIGQLSKLEVMDISENSLQGVIDETHFTKLLRLRSLDLSSNSNLVMKISSDWIPPFHLEKIGLGSCKLGPHFPKWLQTQKKNCFEVNISSCGISDSPPDWLWDFSPNLNLLDLSKNRISGNIHDVKKIFNFSYEWRRLYPEIDLSSNQLQGPIPFFLLQSSSLNLFNNSFSQLDSICNFTTVFPLVILDVSYNQLSGELPDCWSQARDLRILVLANNSLSGKIPVSLGLLISINILHLGNNNFIGELPSSLMNCTDLVIFDVGENNLSGTIPKWIGISVTELIIFSLRSNHFNGSMTSQLCHLVGLQLLDLSSNDISGKIPKCLGNITVLKDIESNEYVMEPYSGARWRRGVYLVLVWKGVISEFRNIQLLKNIDLSSNKLTGEIPRDITKLVGLISFNLSKNNLSGHIPLDIGQLTALDVLDLSNNHFSGQIPSSLSQVYRLSTLDLSCNNLSGEIPKSTQLQTRDASNFMGNPQLCGDPLPKKCPPNEEPPFISNGPTKDGDKVKFLTKGFYISSALGVVVGFWGVCGTLIFNKSLRYAYLKLLDDMGDCLYVTKEVHKRKLLRLIQS